MRVLEGLKYTKDHEWLKVDGAKAYVGITEFAQEALGELVYVELPEVATEFSAGDAYAVVESVKAASDCYMPVSGKVVEVNEAVTDEPGLINEDAFENWLICIELNDNAELDTLLDSEAYSQLCKK